MHNKRAARVLPVIDGDYVEITLLKQDQMNWVPLLLFFAVQPTCASSKAADRVWGMVTYLEMRGEEEIWPALGAQSFDMEGDVPSRVIETIKGNLTRTLRVVYNEADGKRKPVALLVGTIREHRPSLTTETAIYRIELNETFSKAMKWKGKIDEKGEPIEGSAIDLPADVNAADIQDDFQRELEYWLKRVARDKAKKATPASPSKPGAPAKAGPVANSR